MRWVLDGPLAALRYVRIILSYVSLRVFFMVLIATVLLVSSEAFLMLPAVWAVYVCLQGLVIVWRFGHDLPRPVQPENACTYTVVLPKGEPWNAELAGALMRRLLDMIPLALRIVAEGSAIRWQIVDVNGQFGHQLIQAAVQAVYPGAQAVVQRADNPPRRDVFYRRVIPFTQHNREFARPSRYPDTLRDYDPLTALTNLMAGLKPGERLSYTVYIDRWDRKAYKKGLRQITRRISLLESEDAFSDLYFLPVLIFFDILGLLLGTGGRQAKYVPEHQREMVEKLDYRLYHTYLLVQVDVADPGRLSQLNVRVALGEMSSPYQTIVARHPYKMRIVGGDRAVSDGVLDLIDAWSFARDWRYWYVRSLFNSKELTTLWHLPHRAFAAPNIVWLDQRQVPLPPVLKTNRRDVCLGDNLYGGQTTPVYMRNENRETHMIVFGKTGVGKSTLLHHLIRQDIAGGRGVAVVDPHGNLVRDILRASIPPEREEDVIVWDLADREYPPPLNLLAVPTGYDRGQAVAQVMAVFEKIYPDFGSRRMGYYLGKALYTLTAGESPTLLDVARVFQSDDYRWQLLERLDDAELDVFWEKFERRTLRDQDELVLPIMRKLDDFTGSPILRPILCHPDNLDFPSLIAGNKIILISLQPARGMQLPPHAERFLGSVLISQFQMVVMGDVATSRFYLYVDEAQKFVTTSIPEIFNEARKRNLSLTLANQWLRQLAGDTLHAVMGNVGAIIAFQCERADATAIEPYMAPSFSVDDLVHLDMHQAAVFMRFGETQLPAFSLRTRDVPKPDHAKGEMLERRIREASRATYTPKSAGAIQDWLAARYPRRRRGGDDVAFSEPVE